MTLEEAQEIVAEIRRDDTKFFSGPHEYGPTQPRKWHVEGAFSVRQFEALAIALAEVRS